MNVRELQERRGAAVVKMRGLAHKAEAESRDLTADEDTKFGTLKMEISDLDKRIGRAQDLAEAERRAPAISLSGRPPQPSRACVKPPLQAAGGEARRGAVAEGLETTPGPVFAPKNAAWLPHRVAF